MSISAISTSLAFPVNRCCRVLALLRYLCKFGENSNAVSNELQREETHSRQLNSVANNSQLATRSLVIQRRLKCDVWGR